MVIGFRGWFDCLRGSFVRLDSLASGAVRRVEESGFRSKLRADQIEGAAFIASRSGCLLGDEMGLGKTRTALVGVAVQSSRVLILCPAGLRMNWSREWSEIGGEAPVVLADSAQDVAMVPAGPVVVVVSFSRLAGLAKALRSCPFGSVIIDEAHYLKNSFDVGDRKAHATARLHRTAATFFAVRDIPHVVLLTGTPLPNRPRELFNLLRLTRHRLGDSFKRFGRRFCAGADTRFGFVADGATNIPELQSELTGWLLMRTKAGVGLHLPEKRLSLRTVELEAQQRVEYDRAWHDRLHVLRAALAPGASLDAQALRRISHLRQLVSAFKVPAALALLEATQEKVVVFGCFTETLTTLCDSLPCGSFVRYDGSLSEAQRVKAVDTFQSDPTCRFFVSNLEAGKTGLNLTAGARVLLLDLSWTPADLHQGADRVHRPGQTKPVRVVFLAVKNTIDDYVIGLLALKRQVSDGVLRFDALGDHSREIATAAVTGCAERLENARPRPTTDDLDLGLSVPPNATCRRPGAGFRG